MAVGTVTQIAEQAMYRRAKRAEAKAFARKHARWRDENDAGLPELCVAQSASHWARAVLGWRG
jgi:hypothetical protein